MKIEERYGNIYLIEKRGDNTAQELKATVSGRKLCVCDLCVEGSEKGEIAGSGAIRFDDLLIIDHHPNLPEMRGHVCSTTFAHRYVAKCGPLGGGYAVVINHTDTDSILSSLIMCGMLEPRDEFDEAAIAADHTGEENLISDVLQALEDDRCLQRSIEVLQRILERRIWVRQKLRALRDCGRLKMDGDVACGVLDEKIDAGLLPWLFPEAKVALCAWLMPEGSKGKWAIKARVCGCSDCIDLKAMNLPDTGGRWDAVSTTRHDGTNTEPEEYVKTVKEGIEQQEKRHGGI